MQKKDNTLKEETFAFSRILAFSRSFNRESSQETLKISQPRKFIIVDFVEAKQISPRIKGCQSCNSFSLENLHYARYLRKNDMKQDVFFQKKKKIPIINESRKFISRKFTKMSQTQKFLPANCKSFVDRLNRESLFKRKFLPIKHYFNYFSTRNFSILLDSRM